MGQYFFEFQGTTEPKGVTVEKRVAGGRVRLVIRSPDEDHLQLVVAQRDRKWSYQSHMLGGEWSVEIDADPFDVLDVSVSSSKEGMMRFTLDDRLLRIDTTGLSDEDLLRFLPYILSLRDSFRLNFNDPRVPLGDPSAGAEVCVDAQTLPQLIRRCSSNISLRSPAHMWRGERKFELVRDLRDKSLSLRERFELIASSAAVVTDHPVDIQIATILDTHVGAPEVVDHFFSPELPGEEPPRTTTGEEKRRIYDALVHRGGILLEIGVYHGHTAQFLSGIDERRYIYVGVDPLMEFVEGDVGKEHLRRWGRDYYIRGDSTTVAEIFDLPIDVLFIDGNHERSQVIRDTLLWAPKVRLGGVIVEHDVYNQDVWEAVNQVLGPPDYISGMASFKVVDRELYDKLHGTTSCVLEI